MHVCPPASLQAFTDYVYSKDLWSIQTGDVQSTKRGFLGFPKSTKIRDPSRHSDLTSSEFSCWGALSCSKSIYSSRRNGKRALQNLVTVFDVFLISSPPFFFLFCFFFLLQEIQYSLFLENRSSSSYTGTITLLCYFILGIPTRTWWLAVAGL